MSHTTRVQKPLLTRIRRIKGQAEALERAITDETECAAVLQQIAAIRGAVNGLMTVVLEGHIREHLGAEEMSSSQRQKEVEQIIQTLRSYLK